MKYVKGMRLLLKGTLNRFDVIKVDTIITLKSLGGNLKYLSPSEVNQYYTTANVDSVFRDHVEKYAPKNLKNKPLWLMTGLLEETGELLQILRENQYKNKEINRDHLTEELGDIFYYLTGIMTEFNISLDDIILNNIVKLNKRFPKGEYNIQSAIDKRDHNE